MRIGRRQLLQGFAATSALLFAAVPSQGAARPLRMKSDPEPLLRFSGFSEGFYRAGESVYYIDEQQMGWAPRSLDRSRLEPIALDGAGLPVVLALLRKRHWAWAIEHAVLLRLEREPALAHNLLAAAIEISGPTPLRSIARLRHLQLALATRSRTRLWRSTTTDGRAFATILAPIERTHGLVPSSN